MYHTFSSEGFVKLFMEDARIKVLIVSQDMPDVELNNFDQVCGLCFKLKKYNKSMCVFTCFKLVNVEMKKMMPELKFSSFRKICRMSNSTTFCVLCFETKFIGGFKVQWKPFNVITL